MVDYHPVDDDTLVPRIQAAHLAAALASHPVVVLQGARQTGKSTLARFGPGGRGRRYFSLDDLDVLDTARREPDALLTGSGPVTIDEVQREPALMLGVKRAVDRARVPGQFLLTGSANLLLMRSVSETLAGRAVYVRLPGLTWGETEAAAPPAMFQRLLHADDAEAALEIVLASERARPARPLEQAILAGGFPIPALRLCGEARRLWFDGYVQTYLERDLRQISSVESLVEFRRLMRVAALQTGRLLNHAGLARAAGLPSSTASRYLSLLEGSFLIHRIAPYSVNRSKRLIKAPKLYWADTGLMAYLGGVFDAGAIARSDVVGSILESWVVSHLQTFSALESPPIDVCHWRTAGGVEVDFVLEGTGVLLPIECKWTAHPRAGDLRGLIAFLD